LKGRKRFQWSTRFISDLKRIGEREEAPRLIDTFREEHQLKKRRQFGEGGNKACERGGGRAL